MDDLKILVGVELNTSKSQRTKFNADIDKIKLKPISIDITISKKSIDALKQTVRNIQLPALVVNTKEGTNTTQKTYNTNNPAGNINKFRLALGAANTEMTKLQTKWNNEGIFTGNLEMQFNKLQSFKNSISDTKGLNMFALKLKIVKKIAENLKLEQPTKSVKDFNAGISQTLSEDRLENFMRVNSNAMSDFSNEYEGLKSKIYNIDSPEALKVWNKDFQSLTTSVKAAGKTGLSAIDSLTAGMKKFFTWISASGGVMLLINQLRGAFNELKNIDTILTEISKTSELTSAQLKKIGKDSFQTASEFGATAGSYLEGVQEFYRAGKNNAEDLAELSTISQTAGDMTAELANEYIIATDAAYKFRSNVTKLSEVLDGQNQVTNKNAIKMEDLAAATKLVGSQAAQAGISIQQLTGVVGTMQVITQLGGEVAARAARGLLMSIQQVKGELDDGEIIDAEALSKSEKAASAFGVSLKEIRNGVLVNRDSVMVLQELSKAYVSAAEGDIRRSQLIEALGGKHRGVQVAALLSNWETYEKIMSDYASSTGSAMAEAEKTANSWGGRLNTLTNTWNKFISNFTNTEHIKSLISILTLLVKGLDKLTDSGRGLPILVASISAISALTSKKSGRLNMPSYLKVA